MAGLLRHVDKNKKMHPPVLFLSAQVTNPGGGGGTRLSPPAEIQPDRAAILWPLGRRFSCYSNKYVPIPLPFFPVSNPHNMPLLEERNAGKELVTASYYYYYLPTFKKNLHPLILSLKPNR